MISLRKVIIILVFLIIGIPFSTNVCYLIFGLIIIITILISLFRTRIRLSLNQIEDIIPFLFFVTWLYGFVIGFINHNQPNYIVANFAGMVVYLSYYVFLFLKIPKITILKTAFLGGVSITLSTILIFYLNKLNIISMFLTWASTGQERVFITILSSAYITWLYTISVILLPNEKQMQVRSILNLSYIKALIVFICCSYSLLFLTASKGFALGIIFYLLLMPFLFYSQSFLKAKLNIKLFTLGSIIIALSIMYFSLGYEKIISTLFAQSDISNKIRYDQVKFILKDLNFWGHGLGSIINGYVRSPNNPYGFELVYLNLVHKFGFMSIILFLGWSYLFYKIIIKVSKGEDLPYNIAALGALGYMLPSLGNPLLMHPGCVMLNCFALYLTRKPINEI